MDDVRLVKLLRSPETAAGCLALLTAQMGNLGKDPDEESLPAVDLAYELGAEPEVATATILWLAAFVLPYLVMLGEVSGLSPEQFLQKAAMTYQNGVG